MDAFFQKLASNVFFKSSKSAPATQPKQPKPMLLASSSPRSLPMHQTVKRSIQEPCDLPRRSIAHWDKKREKCANCGHIYLKTLSKHPGFCSIDCKSNMAYLETVNRAIRAMRNTMQEQKSSEHNQQQTLAQDIVKSECKTYAEFGLESRIHEGCNVEWVFSAMY